MDVVCNPEGTEYRADFETGAFGDCMCRALCGKIVRCEESKRYVLVVKSSDGVDPKEWVSFRVLFIYKMPCEPISVSFVGVGASVRILF